MSHANLGARDRHPMLSTSSIPIMLRPVVVAILCYGLEACVLASLTHIQSLLWPSLHDEARLMTKLTVSVYDWQRVFNVVVDRV